MIKPCSLKNTFLNGIHGRRSQQNRRISIEDLLQIDTIRESENEINSSRGRYLENENLLSSQEEKIPEKKEAH